MLAKFSHIKKYCDCTCSYYNLITQVAGGQSLLPPGSRRMCILSFRQSTMTDEIRVIVHGPYFILNAMQAGTSTRLD